MSCAEFRKKGKEVVTSEKNPSNSLHHVDHFDHIKEVPMFFSEQQIASLLEANKETCRGKLEQDQIKNDIADKVDNQEKNSSSSKITPCIFYTSDEKARLRWTSDLHNCFVNAVAKLGGPEKATPKNVKQIMEVEGIALHHVKSRLQKFRLGKCNIRDGTYQSNKRIKTIRGVTRTCATSNPSCPRVNIKPKVTETVKLKKEKEVNGSLYMRIKHDLQLQRIRETHRIQMAFTIENQHNMLGAQYAEAGMIPSVDSQHNNYISTTTHITTQPTSQNVEHYLATSSYHFPLRETIEFKMNDPKQQDTIISTEDLCNDKMACLLQHTSNICSTYESHHLNNSMIHSNQGHEKYNDNDNYNMAQYFMNPYMTIEPQSMHVSSSITTQQQLQLNDEYVTQNSHHNATCLPSTILSTIRYSHQDTSSNSIPLATTPQSIQAYVPHQVYNSYPSYNTLEVVKAKLDALQTSNTSQTRETPYHEMNLLSSRDDVDHVDMYIDWSKVEENDIELDPVEILLDLGF